MYTVRKHNSGNNNVHTLEMARILVPTAAVVILPDI